MDINEFYERLHQYELNNDNYKQWRKIHGNAFGNTFLSAFKDNEEAQIHLTSALINISQRKFDIAIPKLKLLEIICNNEFDEAVVNYFTGLNYEFLENESKMIEYYEKLITSDVKLTYGIAFHPYYRTAKFAQRDAECSKALHYYFKSLKFYDDTDVNINTAKIICFILYDIATLYMYMHEYDKAKQFLDLSYKYDSSANQQRDYVRVILSTLKGETDDSNLLLQNMAPVLRESCQTIVEQITCGTELHYCTVPQNRSAYGNFWQSFLREKDKLRGLVSQGNRQEAETILSQMLTDTFSFMRRSLACRIEESSDGITVKCKNYCVKTLEAEHKALFSLKDEEISDWKFVTTDYFEHYI